MSNVIKINDAPYHLISYCMGVLAGLGIDYQVNPGSQLYKELRERHRGRMVSMYDGKGDLYLEGVTSEGIKILNGKGLNDTKVDARLVFHA